MPYRIMRTWHQYKTSAGLWVHEYDVLPRWLQGPMRLKVHDTRQEDYKDMASRHVVIIMSIIAFCWNDCTCMTSCWDDYRDTTLMPEASRTWRPTGRPVRSHFKVFFHSLKPLNTCSSALEQIHSDSVWLRILHQNQHFLSPHYLLFCPPSFTVLSCWTAALVSDGWPRSWRTRCRRGDGRGRCKRPRWTRWRRCEGLGPSWRCIRGWRSGSARHLYTSCRKTERKEKRDKSYYFTFLVV